MLVQQFDSLFNPVRGALGLDLSGNGNEGLRVARRRRAPSGNIVVMGTDVNESNPVATIIYNASLNPVAPAAQASFIAPGVAVSAAVAASLVGPFTAAWWNSAGNIIARTFDVNGNPLTSEVTVNSSVGGTRSYPGLVYDGKNELWIAWGSNQSGNYDIYLRRFGSDGTALGPEVLVNQYLTGDQTLQLAIGDDGTVAVPGPAPTTRELGFPHESSIPDGSPATAEFEVNQYQPGDQYTGWAGGQRGTVVSDGNYIFTWLGSGAQGAGVYMTTFSYVSNGPPVCSSYSFPSSPASAGSGASTGIAALVTNPTTNCPYSNVVSNNPDWITITSGSSGSGSNTIHYSIAANNSGGSRTGSFTVLLSNGLAVTTFTINQAAASCSSLTPAPSELTFGQGGGSGTVNFNTSPCSWSITSNQPWVTLPASSGTGSSFTFAVQPNSGATRQAALSINGGALTVGITETGLVCTYSIEDSSGGVRQSFTSKGGTGTIYVASPPGCPWTAAISQPFITISGNLSASGNGSLNYSVAPNSSSNPQVGTITIAGLAYVINEQPAASQPYSCSASSVTSLIRPEGFPERVADVVLTCSGQAPSGGLTGDILISFSAGITNLLLSTTQTDTLLLEDEPTAANLALGTNAFRGFLSSTNGAWAILFPGVPLAVSGGTLNHTWRITNARVNAQGLAAGSDVQATVSIASSVPFNVTSQAVVASVSSASKFSIGAASTASGQTTQPVSFTEGFATAFGPRVLTGQDPSQVGTVYNSESGYVNTAKLGAQTGFATTGTRLIAVIANVPSSVSVYAPATPVSGTNAEVTSADATGAGGFLVPGTTEFNGIFYQQVVLTGGAGVATWEVTASDPTKIETLTFNLLLMNPNNVSLGSITYAGALAPVSSGPAPQVPSTKLPVPRFASSAITVAPPTTVGLSVKPQQVSQGQSQGAALKSALRSEAAPASSVVGGTVTWTQLQANTGAAGASTAPNVAVGGTLPPSWVITSCTPVDSGGVCPTIDPTNPSNPYSVTYPSLYPGQTGTIMLPAQ